ncbi:MAG: DNA repair protein RecO [Lachnospiraceae bacterium]|nr:DNA repair protein RecO [Lachnospiraceae bacterium]MBQ1399877.1 DNA repair protein RecO [Lachnospiraceae bacterium]MBQ1515088.1 DNA repair protein RecO [Lachnospiraceae bacterium]MBQ4308727.1 DNA repair protein RecO [Lachnospiraceae bacterium]MBQ9464785.1 DNA repair protein RecO [Lachnospiraceae bacterium]
MRDAAVSGMVLSSMPIGEYDRRVVILTRERGKIAAFARGARRPNSPLSACCRPFATGEFELFQGRDSYSLKSARILDYFEGIQNDMEAVYYGYYFAEFADRATRENNDETEMLSLLYAALKALSKEAIPNELVKAVYELKGMILSGDYPGGAFADSSELLQRTEEFLAETPPERIFTFSLREDAAREFIARVDKIRAYYIDRPFASLSILREIVGPGIDS